MSAINQLLRLTSEYCRATGLDAKTLSWRMLKDSKKLGAIADGKDIQVKRLEAAVEWLSAHWPDGASWPNDIDRPARSEAAA